MSQITRITFSSGKERKKPAAGDMRYLKGRKVWQIRQQQMMKLYPSSPRMAYVVSNGRPVWEWVDRCSERDRQWQWTMRGAREGSTQLREHFEMGCLCIVEGKIKIDPNETNAAAADRYMQQCTCSRHPDSGEKK